MARVRGVMAALHGLRVEAVGVRVHIGEHRHGAGLEHGHRRAVPGIGRDDDFIAELEAERLDGGEQRDRAVGETDAVFGAMQFRKARGEFAGVLAGHREPAPVTAFDDAHDALDVRGPELRPGREGFLAEAVLRQGWLVWT